MLETYTDGEMRIRFGGWRWNNIPVPRTHATVLVAGIYLQRRLPWTIPADEARWQLFGWALVASGALVVASSVTVAGETRMERPHRLIAEGPYAHSRNPMYVAWTLVYLGIAIASRTVWLFLALPAVVLATHGVVLREERTIEERFGDEYREYANRVPRYLSLPDLR